ncbi:hypothetical protein EW146_g8223 [Bondarzewia mesenterica]|uniref:Uncharacterized protein n=1 Tax=Bondarzewia mesenterica TaxID=1095465 RepID=A0A4S4LLM1_9AGAM|nr:hypothetical protein EW146_g8223 [Bondarzewia mesenterica]
MPAATQSEVNALYGQIRKRLVESGEWDRISLLLMYKLNEEGWVDEVRGQTKDAGVAQRFLEQARVMEPLSLRKLLEGAGADAHGELPSFDLRPARIIDIYLILSWCTSISTRHCQEPNHYHDPPILGEAIRNLTERDHYDALQVVFFIRYPSLHDLNFIVNHLRAYPDFTVSFDDLAFGADICTVVINLYLNITSRQRLPDDASSAYLTTSDISSRGNH